jgi:hypothetical protein
MEMDLKKVVSEWLDENKSKYPKCEVYFDGTRSVVVMDTIHILIFIDDFTLRSTGNFDEKLTKMFGDPFFNVSSPGFFTKLTKYFDYLSGYIDA